MTSLQGHWTLLCLLLVVVPGIFSASDDSVRWSESVGGLYGNEFSDEISISAGQTIGSITIYVSRNLVNGVSLEVIGPKAAKFMHGGSDGEKNVLKLGAEEYITSMEVHWGKNEGYDQIFYLSFTTSAGNSVSGGSMTERKNTVMAPEGFQLGGFFGLDSDAIDKLGVIWTRISTEDPESLSASQSGDSATDFLEASAAAKSADIPESADGVLIGPTAASAESDEADSASTSTDGLDKPPIAVKDSPNPAAQPDIAGSLSEVKTKTNKRAVQLSESFGGPHGEQFSDQLAIMSGMTVASVTIRAAERLDGLTVRVSAPKEMTFTHGGTGGTENTLTLEPGEYITTMEAHWDKKETFFSNGHTRIFYLSLGTSKGKTVSGGTMTAQKGSVTAPNGYQLAGFFGRDGDEINHLGAVWSSIAVVNETIVPSVPANDDIVLSELFGGPHGTAFSDITKIKFGQTVSSVSIRSAERLDAVTLQIASPLPLTLNHGGGGGTEKTLTLAPDEVITSVEAHWAKKNRHTRIFYICFITSAGNRLEGGTQTDQKGTTAAPEGFVLSGFYGRAGDKVDQLGVIWTRNDSKEQFTYRSVWRGE
ncbi:unnamed protein product [Peronospora destructor]|uniref:Jacalin-type lectin domain-containing protein n=1 Tax=Peronospora destructor TaxID=86335 RepID=A0AAV0VBX2_9STRA|nr:unnamed protein product [Peronospora destructor]